MSIANFFRRSRSQMVKADRNYPKNPLVNKHNSPVQLKTKFFSMPSPSSIFGSHTVLPSPRPISSSIRFFSSSASRETKQEEQLKNAGFKITTYEHPMQELQEAGFAITTIQNTLVAAASMQTVSSAKIDRIGILMDNLPFKPNMFYSLVDKSRVREDGNIHPGHISFAITDENSDIVLYASYVGGSSLILPEEEQKLIFDVTYPSGKKGSIQLMSGVFREIKDDLHDFFGKKIYLDSYANNVEFKSLYLIGIPSSEFGFDCEQIQLIKTDLHKFSSERYYLLADGEVTLKDGFKETFVANNCITAFLYAIGVHLGLPDKSYDIIEPPENVVKDENYFKSIQRSPSTGIAAVSIYLDKATHFIGNGILVPHGMIRKDILDKSRAHIIESRLINEKDYLKTYAPIHDGRLEVKDNLDILTRLRISTLIPKKEDK